MSKLSWPCRKRRAHPVRTTSDDARAVRAKSAMQSCCIQESSAFVKSEFKPRHISNPRGSASKALLAHYARHVAQRPAIIVRFAVNHKRAVLRQPTRDHAAAPPADAAGAAVRTSATAAARDRRARRPGADALRRLGEGRPLHRFLKADAATLAARGVQLEQHDQDQRPLSPFLSVSLAVHDGAVDPAPGHGLRAVRRAAAVRVLARRAPPAARRRMRRRSRCFAHPLLRRCADRVLVRVLLSPVERCAAPRLGRGPRLREEGRAR